MLSGETSVGEHPITAVETMARIIESTEDHGLHHMREIDWQPHTRGGIIAKAAAEVAEAVGAKFLVAFTVSGDSAKRLSRYRGPIPVLAFTPRGAHPLAARADLGRRDLPGCRGRAHRRDGAPGRRGAARTSAASRRATSSSSSPARPPASPARPTRCASTGWATRSTASRRPTAALADRPPRPSASGEQATFLAQDCGSDHSPGAPADTPGAQVGDPIPARNVAGSRATESRRTSRPECSAFGPISSSSRATASRRAPPRPTRVAQLWTRQPSEWKSPRRKSAGWAMTTSSLPLREHDRALVLAPGPVLGEKARPVLPVRATTGARAYARDVLRGRGTSRTSTLADEPRTWARVRRT